MNTTKLVVGAVVGGIIIALLTGLFETTPAGLIGSAHYGFPLAWRFVCVGCLGQPTSVEWGPLIGDIVVWAVIVAIVLFVVSKGRKK